MISSASSALANQNSAGDAAARSTGFENAEHEALAFFGSDWFDQLVQGIKADEPDRPGTPVPDDYVRAAIDRAYGDRIEVVTSIDDPEIPRRKGRRRRGKGYTRPLSNGRPAVSLLHSYGEVIRQERVPLDCFILELPGVQMEGISK